MNSPFKVGDTVYTPEGEFTVKEVCSNDYYIGKPTDHRGTRSRWTPKEYLSFTPWPKPNHERPTEKGWWVVKGAIDYLIVSFWDGEKWMFLENGKMWIRTGDYTPIHFIGKHIEGVNT